MIGFLQWEVSLGRIDIRTVNMTMSSFRSVPRKVYLDRTKRIHSYVSKMRYAAIIIRTEEPDFSTLPKDPNICDQSIYGHMREETQNDVLKPLGKFVVTTHYVDANLFHDIMTCRSVTGILHLKNRTPFDWYSKK